MKKFDTHTLILGALFVILVGCASKEPVHHNNLIERVERLESLVEVQFELLAKNISSSNESLCETQLLLQRVAGEVSKLSLKIYNVEFYTNSIRQPSMRYLGRQKAFRWKESDCKYTSPGQIQVAEELGSENIDSLVKLKFTNTLDSRLNLKLIEMSGFEEFDVYKKFSLKAGESIDLVILDNRSNSFYLTGQSLDGEVIGDLKITINGRKTAATLLKLDSLEKSYSLGKYAD